MTAIPLLFLPMLLLALVLVRCWQMFKSLSAG